MIDNFALALTHGLLALAVWRLLRGDALDAETPDVEPAIAPPSEAPTRFKLNAKRGAAHELKRGPNA